MLVFDRMTSYCSRGTVFACRPTDPASVISASHHSSGLCKQFRHFCGIFPLVQRPSLCIVLRSSTTFGPTHDNLKTSASHSIEKRFLSQWKGLRATCSKLFRQKSDLRFTNRCSRWLDLGSQTGQEYFCLASCFISK